MKNNANDRYSIDKMNKPGGFQKALYWFHFVLTFNDVVFYVDIHFLSKIIMSSEVGILCTFEW